MHVPSVLCALTVIISLPAWYDGHGWPCVAAWNLCADLCAVWHCCLQDIQQRAANKDHMLALVNAERKATNDRKRIERELFDSLRRDKVDSIQKMQVRGCCCSWCFCLRAAAGTSHDLQRHPGVAACTARTHYSFSRHLERHMFATAQLASSEQ